MLLNGIILSSYLKIVIQKMRRKLGTSLWYISVLTFPESFQLTANDNITVQHATQIQLVSQNLTRKFVITIGDESSVAASIASCNVTR